MHIAQISTWSAAYYSETTHMVTEEASAERKAAQEGDPGTDSAVKVEMPQEPYTPTHGVWNGQLSL